MYQRPQKKRKFLLSLILMIVTFILITPLPAADSDDLIWDATLTITETSGKTDYIYIGEAPDANDGPPADTYDMPKAPTSPPPYLRLWADDNLNTPYTQLLGDYRTYPDSSKQWNISILWYPQNPTDPPTNVTLTWNVNELSQNEYTNIGLYTTDNILLANMLQTNSFTFSCPIYTPQHYHIKCSGTNTPPTIPTTPTGPITGYHNSPYSYSTTATDPENDPISYQFNWDDNTISPWTTAYPSGATCTTSYTWQIPGTYNITVKARDSHQTETTWSNPLTITMLNRNPTAPTNPIPAPSATEINTNTKLQWTCTDPDSDSLTYDIYLGETPNPPRIVTEQAMTSFTPTLESETHYYWKIVAHDEYNGQATSQLWNFTTKKTDSSGGGSSGGGGGIIENLPPDANASLSDTNGFVHSQIQFDGSLSTDDGYITAWEWDFDDGHFGSGEKTTHIYTTKGEYQVTLTVTDDAGSQSQDLLTISIITANTPPESPYIEGIENGTNNQNYHFIISSSDIDNDTLHIEIEWGDTTNETIQLNSSEQQVSITHSWTLPGPYTIRVRVFDSYTWSSTTEKTVLIDTLYFPDVGYLIDTDNDSVYDVVRLDESGVEYSLKKLSSTEYVYDSDNDDIYDFVLDIASLSILDYSPEIEDNTQLIFAMVIIIIIAIILIFIFIKYKK